MSDIAIRTIVTDHNGKVLSDVTQTVRTQSEPFLNWTPSWTITTTAPQTWDDNNKPTDKPAPPVKRGPGRPRKDGSPPQPRQENKRKPGRPRKADTPV